MKKLIIFYSILLSTAFTFFACDVSVDTDNSVEEGDDDDTATDDDDNDVVTDDDDDTATDDDGQEISASEEICREKLNSKIESGKPFIPGVYHIRANVYANNQIVNKTLDGPIPMDLWMLLGATSISNPADECQSWMGWGCYCATEESWSENGDTCCAAGESNCSAYALLCFVNLPDEGGNDLDAPVRITEDGQFVATITNIAIPMEIDPNLREDAVSTITMTITFTGETCLKADMTIHMSKVTIGSMTFNDVTLKNTDIETTWRGYEFYPSYDPAVGWWERFWNGDDAEIETPFPAEDAITNPENVETEPVCLDPSQKKVREY